MGTVSAYPDHVCEWGDIEAIAWLWSRATIREAVQLASPSLVAQIEKLLATPDADAPLKRRKRLHRGLLKYALRMSTRCTPFGVFAGVAVLPVGDDELKFGDAHVRHVRATGAVTRRLVEQTRMLPQARLYPNPSLSERAGRLVVSVMRGSDDTHTRASIRATGPARLAVATASGTATREDIELRVSAVYSAADSEKVRQLVTDLLDAEVLLCEAEHSAFDGDPLARVPDEVEGVAEIREAVAQYADSSDPVGDGSLSALLRLCAAGDVQRDIHVDLELDVSGRVPMSVIDAAQAAVRVLTATMAHLPANPALGEFSATFTERYGQTLVPFLTAIDEELGIGFPRAYEPELPLGHVPTKPDGAAVERRRDFISSVLLASMTGGLDVVELTDSDLAGFPEPDNLPSSFDIMLRLHRDQEDLQATVIGVAMPGGSALGRFTAVMPQARDCAQRWVDFDGDWWANKTGGRGILCGIDYIAGADMINEVSATAQLYPVTLALNARPPSPAGRLLTLADIYLGIAEGQMCIVLADGTPVSVRQLNMATIRASSKAIRLLREISDAQTQHPFWSWGEAEAAMNKLPEVRYRGVTLVEQKWRYPSTEGRSVVELREWLIAAGISRYIRVGPHDNLLHLDTQNPVHVDLLLSEITAGNRWLIRAPSPDQMGVVRDQAMAMHPAEVVVTVAAPHSKHVEPSLDSHPLHNPADDNCRLLVPGGAWTAFAISAGGGSHDRSLRDFADCFPDLAGEWYFVRYRQDGRDQLRLRVHRPVAEVSDVLAWLAEARLSGRIGDYSIPTYHRELERYGGPRSFPCYERLFCCETAYLVNRLPIVGADSGMSRFRPGIEAAAGVLAQWFDALDPGHVNVDEVIDFAVEGYCSELGARVHAVKAALRQQHLSLDVDSDFVAVLRKFWSDPAQHSAVVTPAVLQSASHLLCNRLGMSRQEEFAALWMVRTERNRCRRRHDEP
ncbi:MULTISPECIES: lantibiotic dehydratase [Mycolicibacterium]|nr:MULTISPECIES: lantibiotic dehydratase [Mycolicibacterium]